MNPANDWQRWEAAWRAARAAPAELDAMIARARSARRTIGALRVLSAALALASLAAVGLALHHAGNALETALGLAVGIGIAALWLADALQRDRAADGLTAAPAEYRAIRLALCRRQIRFARLAWSVIALELVFLVPWWIGGIKVHGMGFSLLRIEALWAPLAAMTLCAAWTLRLHARARMEIQALARGAHESGDD